MHRPTIRERHVSADYKKMPSNGTYLDINIFKIFAAVFVSVHAHARRVNLLSQPMYAPRRQEPADLTLDLDDDKDLLRGIVCVTKCGALRVQHCRQVAYFAVSRITAAVAHDDLVRCFCR